MTFFQIENETHAEAVHRMVHASFAVFEEVTKARVKNPDSHPIVPKERVQEVFAKRLLAGLLDAGFKPEGWEEAFIKDSPYIFEKREK